MAFAYNKKTGEVLETANDDELEQLLQAFEEDGVIADWEVSEEAPESTTEETPVSSSSSSYPTSSSSSSDVQSSASGVETYPTEGAAVTPSQRRQQFMSDVPFGRQIAKIFPYSTEEFMRYGKSSPNAGMNDVYSLLGRTILPGDMGTTSEETRIGSSLPEQSAETLIKMVRSPATFKYAPAFAAAGGNVFGNALVGGVMGYDEGGDFKSAAFGAGLGAGASALPYAPKLASDLMYVIRRGGLEALEQQQRRAITNIALRGPGSKPLSNDETDRLFNAHKREIYEFIENMEPKQLDALVNDYSKQMYEMASSPEGVSRVTGETIGKTQFKTANQIGRELSNEEKELLKAYARSQEEYESLVMKAAEAKQNGKNILGVIDEQLKNAEAQSENSLNAALLNSKQESFSNAVETAKERLRLAKENYEKSIHSDEIKVVEGEERELLDSYKNSRLEDAEMRQKNRDAQNAVYEELGLSPKKSKNVQKPPMKTKATEEYLGNLKKPDIPGEMAPVQSGRAWEYYAKQNLDLAEKNLEKIEKLSPEDFEGSVGKKLIEETNAAIERWQRLYDNKKAYLAGEQYKFSTEIGKKAEEVAGAKSAVAEEGKSHRSLNYARGNDQYVESTRFNSPRAETDDVSKDFIVNLRKNVDKATTKMSAELKGPEGNFRRDAKGRLYSIEPNANGNRGRRTIQEFENRILAKQRAISQGQTGIKDPAVYNEDVVWAVNKLQESNDYELIDAVLESASWLTDAEKESIRHQALMLKGADNLKRGYNVKVGERESEIGGMLGVVADKIPGVGLYRGIKRITNGEKSVLSPAVTRAYNDLQRYRLYNSTPYNYFAPTTPGELAGQASVAPYGLASGVVGKDRKKK